jgi:hypothetical protein
MLQHPAKPDGQPGGNVEHVPPAAEPKKKAKKEGTQVEEAAPKSFVEQLAFDYITFPFI